MVLELTPANVNQIFKTCLFKEGETITSDNMLKVAGITADFGFNLERVTANRETIIGFLNCLSPEFQKGRSFLDMCLTVDEVLWTGNHNSCQELMCLGMAIGMVQYCTSDRALWQYMVGGVPMIYINLPSEV